MIEVKFMVYTGEDYESMIERVQASLGWLEMTITDMEQWDSEDAVAEMVAWFDSEAHAMLFRLKQGI